MEFFDVYAGGKFLKTSKELPVINPFTNEVFAKTFLVSEKEINEAIDSAQQISIKLKEIPSYKISEILRFIGSGISDQKKYFSDLLCKESAKPVRYAMAEVERAAQTFFIAAEECKRLPKEYISLDWTSAGENKEGIVKSFPVGLIAGISPFNFPLNLAVHKIAPAIAARCPIILKPSSSTPLSTLALARIIDKSDLPKGAVSIVPCSRETGNLLVRDERFKLLSFTGSPVVGWKMKREAGKKKVVLELGGNAACIISPSANLELAVKKCVIGGFSYSGQICIHTQRIYIHESIFKLFSEKFVDTVKSLKKGNPLDADTEISAMIDEGNAIRTEQWVSEAVAEGAGLLYGAKRTGNYFEPTVLTKTHSAMKVNCEEIFGPVVMLESYSTIEEAVKLINDTQFGLQAGLFSDSAKEINYAFENLEVGGLIINDVPTFRVDNMPYGGIKDSGLGREGVKYAIQDMLEPRLLVKPIL